jgi:programmed cell death 6-interacting protein
MLSACGGQEPSPDLRPDSLHALSALMLAQGQEVICRKALKDKMKDAIVAKLAQQCSDLYADAMKLAQLQSIRDQWPRVSAETASSDVCLK